MYTIIFWIPKPHSYAAYLGHRTDQDAQRWSQVTNSRPKITSATTKDPPIANRLVSTHNSISFVIKRPRTTTVPRNIEVSFHGHESTHARATAVIHGNTSTKDFVTSS